MNYNIFDSYIWKTSVDYNKKYELVENLILDYNKNKNKNKLTPGWNCLVYSSFEDKKNNNIPEDLIDIIENKVKKFISEYPSELKINGVYAINQIWYNIYDKNHFQEPHNHGDALFSGCYYLKFNKKFHHQTNFYNPNFNLDYSKLEENPYFCFTPDCEEDDLIIFPSLLKHGTKGIKKNFSDELRITISFNIVNLNICINDKSYEHKKMSYK